MFLKYWIYIEYNEMLIIKKKKKSILFLIINGSDFATCREFEPFN